MTPLGTMSANSAMFLQPGVNFGQAILAHAATLAAGSPSSAALVWELWHRARHLGLAEVFRLELVVSLQCCEHPDFAEGVRALLVDKDNQPRWMPQTLAGITPQWVAEHFVAPWSAWANESHPLADL